MVDLFGDSSEPGLVVGTHRSYGEIPGSTEWCCREADLVGGGRSPKSDRVSSFLVVKFLSDT